MSQHSSFGGSRGAVSSCILEEYPSMCINSVGPEVGRLVGGTVGSRSERHAA